MKRSGRDVPTGVSILAGLFLLIGSCIVLFSVLINIIAFSIALFGGFQENMGYFIMIVLSASFYAVMGGLFFLCGSWLSSLQLRGWMLATVGSGLYILLALANISFSGSLSWGLLWHAIIAAIILVYLNIPATKRAFGR